MKILVLYDGYVGAEIAEWLAANFSDDIVATFRVRSEQRLPAKLHPRCRNFVYSTDEDFSSVLAEIGPVDLGLLLWWPKLVSAEILHSTRLGFINTHPSMLPYNRGKNYNFWALVEQCPFGVSLHFVDEGIDSGDIVAQKAIPYSWEDTGETLFYKAQQSMISLFQDTYPVIRTGNIPRTSQDLSVGSTHYSKELEPASQIDLDKSYVARDILNLLRARTFEGYPGCRFEDGHDIYEVKVKIQKVNK